MPNSDCPVCRTADIVCGKWTLLVIRDLAERRARFCELERSLEGISPRTLSLRLRALEEEGIVARQTFPEVPPRVEYALTDKGRALVPIIESMRSYGREWLVAADTCDERTTRVPYSSAGGASAAVRDGWNRNAPFWSAALTASARRFMRAAYMVLRITHALGAATASGSLPSIRATSWASNVFPFAPTVVAVCAVIPE